MRSKNKPAQTHQERAWVTRIKEQPCVVCDTPGPSEAHEIEQGEWFLTIPLCADCHRGAINGLHGQKAMWRVMKMDELKALNTTIRRLNT